MESELVVVFDEFIEMKSFEKAKKILELVKPTFSRYEEYMGKIEEAEALCTVK